jgi:flagellar biosynthetic protein FliR
MNPVFPIGAYLFPFLLILLRLSMVVFMLPLWSSKQIPRSFKIGFALALAFVLTPVVRVDTAGLPLVTVILQEWILGTVLGLAVRVLFLGVELAGTFISDAMGLSLATVFNPEMGQSTEVSTLLGLLAMLLFLALDLHHDLIALIIKSFEVLPAGRIRTENLLKEGIALGGQVFALALKMAAPVLVSLFVVNLLMGFIYKAAPQVNIFFVSLPVYILVGFLVLFFSLPVLIQFLENRFAGLEETVIRLFTVSKG